MKFPKYIILTCFFLFIGRQMIPAQEYRFINYDVVSGLCDRYVYNIVQGKDGYLWLGTGSGICRYDGFEFVSDFSVDSLPSSVVTSGYRDSNDRLWFGFDNGSVIMKEDDNFRLIQIPEENTSRINGIAEDSEGNIFAATQNNGIIHIISPDRIRIYNEALSGQLISSFYISRSDDLLIGTFDGLFLYNFSANRENLKLTGRFEDIPYTRVQVIEEDKTGANFFIGTEDEGLFFLQTLGKSFRSISISKVGENFNLSYSSIADVYQDEQLNLWVTTNGEGVYKLIWSAEEKDYGGMLNFNRSNGLNARFLGPVYEDIEGNLWFGSTGEGLSVLKDQSFSFYNFNGNNFSDNILSIEQVGKDMWLGSENSILVTDLNEENYLLDIRNGLPNDRITSIYQDSYGKMWIGTAGHGIYKMDPDSRIASRYFLSKNSLENMINDIEGRGDQIYVATNGGVLNFNSKTGSRKLYSTTDGLPHNKIRDVFIDSKANVWIATRSNRIMNITNMSEFLEIDSRAELEFVSITEDLNGNLWAGTNGSGVFAFFKDSLNYYTTENGLLSNFCYSIDTDDGGNIWVGHKQGMSKINPYKTNIKFFSTEYGIYADFNDNAVLTNNYDNLVFGTSNGLIIYDPSKDRPDTIAPMLNITSLRIFDDEFDFSKPVNLPYDIYKIRIEFTGINLKYPDGVSYQYKLDGYDDWSEPTKIPHVTYNRVEDGNYTFMLRACDESGVCTDLPVTLDINIKIPVWKTWWFILLVILTLVVSVFLIIKIREKKQKQIQEYLQKALDERTREVMEQKEEIENKNRDITDSINYAQRIQASILPPTSKLRDTFSGSFVFYQPRDIVSGDFYWYDKVWDNKFVIVCADSTGHGVPGAFMSMIGTTLIKDICSREGVSSPSEILETLDMEIQEALNQNTDAEKSNDGMDIIVAEIDLNTNFLRLASAMRPIVLYIGGEQVYVKGSRNSVGGRFEDDTEEKSFQDEGFQMNKGDIIYMFSDGYPDQFGGPLGKKFKMVRLKNLLRDIHDKSMEEQYNYIKSNFMLWKEDLEQVDDVLFMGIKI